MYLCSYHSCRKRCVFLLYQKRTCLFRGVVSQEITMQVCAYDDLWLFALLHFAGSSVSCFLWPCFDFWVALLLPLLPEEMRFCYYLGSILFPPRCHVSCRRSNQHASMCIYDDLWLCTLFVLFVFCGHVLVVSTVSVAFIHCSSHLGLKSDSHCGSTCACVCS